MAWKFKDGIPMYRQIVETFENKIVSGEYKMGDKIPSVRDLAVEAGVNPNTMQRALSALESEGLLRTERTNGRFVTDNAKVINDVREKKCEGCITKFYHDMSAFGITKEELISIIKKWEKSEGE